MLPSVLSGGTPRPHHNLGPSSSPLSLFHLFEPNWIKCIQLNAPQSADARCEMQGLQLSTLKSFSSWFLQDLILSPEPQKMRCGSLTKLQKSHPRRFTLARAYVFSAPCGKNKIKKATERFGGRGGGISELRGKKVFQPPKSCAVRHRGTIKALKHSHSHSFSFFSFFCV